MTQTFRDLANRQHGPSTGTQPTWPTCPDCGALTYLDPHAFKGTVGSPDLTPARVEVCSGCEWAKELEPLG